MTEIDARPPNPPNPQRGEISARLNGEDRKLVLTLGAMAELESALGEDILVLANRFSEGRVTSADILHILAAGLRGAGDPMSMQDLKNLKFEGGITEGVALASDLLSEALIGDTKIGDTKRSDTAQAQSTEEKPLEKL